MVVSGGADVRGGKRTVTPLFCPVSQLRALEDAAVDVIGY